MSLLQWKKRKLQEYKISQLFYMSLIENARSILQRGILSQKEAIDRNIHYKSFADEDVQDKRENKSILLTDGKKHNIHGLVPLYLTSKTPTLYARKDRQNEIFIAIIQSFIILDENVEFAFCDGNAASDFTRAYYSLNNLSAMPWDVIRAAYWTGYTDGTRKRNAEFLIYPCVPTNRIWGIVVNNDKSKNQLEIIKKEAGSEIDVQVNCNYFF